MLGLRACEPSTSHAAFVRPSTKSPNGPYVVSAMAFLRYYEIDTDEARCFDATLRDEVLCADLRGPFRPVSKRRKNDRPRPRPR